MLTVAAGLPAWAAATGFSNPMTTKGDLLYENATPAPDRIPIGTTGQVLTVVGGVPAWATAGAGTTQTGTYHGWTYDGLALGTNSQFGTGFYAPTGTVANGGNATTNVPGYSTLTSPSANAGSILDNNNSQTPISTSILSQIKFYGALASTSSGIYWIAATAGGAFNTANPNTSIIGFRFVQGTDTNWQAYVGTTSAAGHYTVVDTGIAVNTNFHQFIINVDSSGNYTFYIDGVLVATIAAGSAGIPATTTGLYLMLYCYVGSGTVVWKMHSLGWWSTY